MALKWDGQFYCFQLFEDTQPSFVDTVSDVRSASPGSPARVIFCNHAPVLLQDIRKIRPLSECGDDSQSSFCKTSPV